MTLLILRGNTDKKSARNVDLSRLSERFRALGVQFLACFKQRWFIRLHFSREQNDKLNKRLQLFNHQKSWRTAVKVCCSWTKGSCRISKHPVMDLRLWNELFSVWHFTSVHYFIIFFMIQSLSDKPGRPRSMWKSCGQNMYVHVWARSVLFCFSVWKLFAGLSSAKYEETRKTCTFPSTLL